MDESRISNAEVKIDDDETKNFFVNRTKKNLPHRYNYVLNQDEHPELAIERDHYEKEKMAGFLGIKENSRILDIGCGVGRWADYAVSILKPSKGGQYVGIDYNSNILEIARQERNQEEGCYFFEGSFQQIEEVLNSGNHGGGI